MEKTFRTLTAAAVLACAGCSAPAHGDLEQPASTQGRVRVALPDFPGESANFPGLLDIVRKDLERSGLYTTVGAAPNAGRLTEATPIRYGDWAGSADAVVVGSVGEGPKGRLEVRFRVYDVNKRAALGGMAYTPPGPQGVRQTAHTMADYIHQRISGERGIFNTRIVYTQRRAGSYELYMADADGDGADIALRSPQRLVSPVFSPDGKELAYVSYEYSKADRQHPIAFSHRLVDGRRVVALNVQGLASMTLAWAPNQRSLLILGNTAQGTTFYSVTPEGTDVKSVATSPHQDTRPAFSHDGAWVYFASDRGGSRQIHRMRAEGGEVERVTAGPAENFSPAVSPDGRTLAAIARDNGRNRLVAVDLSTREVSALADAPLDEKISFSPDGRFVLFSVEHEGRHALQSVSARPAVPVRSIFSAAGGADMGEAVWGPYVVQ